MVDGVSVKIPTILVYRQQSVVSLWEVDVLKQFLAARRQVVN